MTDFKLIASLFFFAAIISCQNAPHPPEQEKAPENESKLEQALIQANKSAIEEERYMIKRYIDRHNWDMDQTGSGIYYGIYEDGNGKKAEVGMVAAIDYTVELLNGYECYSSEKGEPKSFIIGQGNVESGLHKIMPYLQEGDRAKVIIPSHLAYGLAGDRKQIPPKSTLVYDLHVINLQKR